MVAGRRRASRRSLYVGIAVSSVAHLLLVMAYPFGGARREPSGLPVVPSVRLVEGMRSSHIVEVAEAEVGNPEDPVEIVDPGQPDATPEVEDFEEGFEVYIPGRQPSLGERLRRENGDPRLWRPISPDLVAPTPDELLRLRLAAAIEAANDSAMAEAERLAESLDWTHTDDQGGRWGVSPGKIHLGDMEIPLPFGFGPPPDYNGDQADWAYRMTDIGRAAGSLAARMSWKDRMEIMRQRREARRAEEEADEDRATATRPDTTGASRRR